MPYLYGMNQTNPHTMDNLQTFKSLRAELKTLAADWSETHDELDAACAIVVMPSKMWRVAKQLGCRKDPYFGWILFSKSTNSNGSEFCCEVSSMCHASGAPVFVHERQL